MGQCLSTALQVVQEVTAEEEQQKQQQQQTTPAVVSSPNGKGDGLSPVYTQLPNGAQKVDVRNVYDGDTLTLKDERRVRFLGIDTPEIKEQQPFAQEAKAYTKDRCNDAIWISYEPGQDEKDHYGRLLCWVWVADGGGYLCVNEGIVAAGFASAYIPNQSSKPHNWDKLIALQDQARKAKRGMWVDFHDATVYKTANGAAYHERNCEHLANVRNLTELKASEAASMGLHPCRTCMS